MVEDKESAERLAKRKAKMIDDTPICPKCDEVVDHLRWYGVKLYDEGKDEHQDLKAERADPSADMILYKCPWCDEVLFETVEGAREFLK